MLTHADLARYQRRPEAGYPHAGPRPYGVGAFLGAYALGLLINIAVLLLATPLIVLAYPITGICLSRYIGRRILWWDMAANIQNVTAVKLGFVLSWPMSMPRFIFKVFVSQFL